jgi:sugar transferase (PEP-CTERM/EpsH1 system associated)
MRILWVKAGGLVPLDTGGKIRSYHILRELARRHSVTLFTFYAAHPNDAHAELQGIFTRVVCCAVELPRPRGMTEFVSYIRHSFSLEPYSMAKYCRPEIIQRLRRLLDEQTYDVIVCDFLIAAGVIPWEDPTPKVLFTHNVEALIWQRHFQVARNPFWKAVCWREYQAMRRVERHYLNLADRVLTVSGTDRNFFAKLTDPRKITTIPTGVDVNFFSPALGQEEANTLVFTGSMDWLPNEDSILYFVREILPRIRRQIPEVCLRVVGRRPSPRLRELATRDRGVDVTGEVEDIRPYLGRASVYVVPLRVGSGTRLKIFEAMAMGRAIVSTSVGAEGLPVKHEENILLADEPEDFAHAVVGLLRDSHRRIELGRAARQLVEEKHGWASVAADFEAALAAVVQNGAGPRKDPQGNRSG